MKLQTLVVSSAVAAALSISPVFAEEVKGKGVGITKGVMEVAGISRNQDNNAMIDPAFAKTSRPCPPKKGMIPHAINVPFTKVNSKALAKDPMAVVDILTGTFGVKDMDGVLNYENAKTLYLYCNGAWCGQSPAKIRALLSMGYPENKIKYYRGGMNAWKSLGLTTK